MDGKDGVLKKRELAVSNCVEAGTEGREGTQKGSPERTPVPHCTRLTTLSLGVTLFRRACKLW